MTTKNSLSKYSIHYQNMDAVTADRAQTSLQRRLEDFRLRLDLENILPWIKGLDVLDFPIGTGRFYPHLGNQYEVYGYDIAKEYVRRAQKKNPDIADHFVECSFENIDRKKTFDTVVTLRTLNNLANVELAVSNVASILRPGGRWIFNYPPGGTQYHDMRSILNRRGFQIVHEKAYDCHGGGAAHGYFRTRMYERYLQLIEAGIVSYQLFRVVDSFLAQKGTRLFVCERRETTDE